MSNTEEVAKAKRKAFQSYVLNALESDSVATWTKDMTVAQLWRQATEDANDQYREHL